jgi:sugar phosphate isomerase/epimerase
MELAPNLCLVGYTYRHWPLRRLFEAAADYGYPWVEVRTCADVDLGTPEGVTAALAQAGALAAEHGVKLGAISLGNLWVGALGDLHRRNPLALDAALLARVRAAGFRQVHLLLERVRPDGGHVLSADEATEEDFRACREAIDLLAEVLDPLDLRAAVEGRPGTISDTLEGLLWSVAPLEHRAVGVLLDFANLVMTNPTVDLVDAVKALHSAIGYIHLKNLKIGPGGLDRAVPLGLGTIDYYRVLSAVAGTGYRGLVGVEYVGDGDLDYFVREDAEYVRWLEGRLRRRR